MLRVGAARKHIHIVVGSARLARIERRRHEPPGLGPVAAAAQLGLAAQLRARKRHAHVVDHRVLHRHLQPVAFAGAVTLAQRGKDADGHQHPGAGVAKGRSRLDRRPVAVAGDAGRAARRLCDHVEGEVFLVRAAGAKALDLAIDDPRVQLPDDVVAQAQPLDRAGRHVLDGDVGLFQQFLDDFEPAGGFQIEGDRFLVGVELVEIPGIVIRLPGPQSAARIADLWIFDLDYLGPEPGERLGAGRPRLELRKINDPNTFETIQLHAGSIHCSSLLFRRRPSKGLAHYNAGDRVEGTGRSGWPRGYLSRNVNKPISPLPTIGMAGLMRVRTSNPNTATATKAVSQPVTAPLATVREPDKSSPIDTGARPR